jgi:hypothetical protein
MNHPLWEPAAKSASVRKWADHLHRQSKDVFLKDKTQTHLLFSFTDDEGCISVTPVPPKTSPEHVIETIQRMIRTKHLYAVISIGEAWVYFHKGEKDHTAFQLLDGEMRVSDLRDEDKTEYLSLRMESRDGDCVVYLDKIMWENGQVELGNGRTIDGEELKWFEQI